MNKYEWVEIQLHKLTSALDGGGCPASRPGRHTARKTAPGTHWVGGRVDLRDDVDVLEEKNACPLAEKCRKFHEYISSNHSRIGMNVSCESFRMFYARSIRLEPRVCHELSSRI